MQPSRVDRDIIPSEPLQEDSASSLGSLERAARIADVKDRMLSCLEELDRLQLVYAANHLSHAIELVAEDPPRIP